MTRKGTDNTVPLRAGYIGSSTIRCGLLGPTANLGWRCM